MNKHDVEKLLTFYREQGRQLPWREQATPYHVWLSEIMLQQTRVEAVKEYYHRFLKTFPTIESLANSTEDQCLLLWQGLGYYSRVRNLRKAAQEVVEKYQGNLPEVPELLKKLPGIGEYTSKAIASIAFQKPYVCIDGNLLRVFSRLTCYENNLKEEQAKKIAENFFLPLLPSRPGDFNQALMDLGEMICIPNGKPLCDRCPLKDCCQAHEYHVELSYPVIEKKPEKKNVDMTVYLLIYENKILLEKRPASGLLASLFQLPNIEQKLTEDQLHQYLIDHGYRIDGISHLGNFQHVFTHLIWNMDCYVVNLKEKPDGIFVSKEEVASYSIPTAFAKILKNYYNRYE